MLSVALVMGEAHLLWAQDKVMAAAQRLLDNAAHIRSWVDLSGVLETHPSYKLRIA